jgi:hypothetical protein
VTDAADPTAATLARYAAYAERIAATSPSYAAWARSLDDRLLDALHAVAVTQRQPELLFAVARRLGADPSDPAALRVLVREARPTLVAALTTATVQANDPRRLAPVVPVLAALSAAAERPLGLVDVGAAAGLCSIPDRVTLDHRVTLESRVTHDSRGPGAPTTQGSDPAPRATLVRMHTAVPGPAVHLVAEATGMLPAPATEAIRIGARVALDPNPIDPTDPDAEARLVEAVPPEATDRTALMREALRATLAGPLPTDTAGSPLARRSGTGGVGPTRIRGRVPDDLDRAVDAVPDDCEPVVMTTGTLVYVPGAGRQRVADRLRERGVRWVALERTGVLRDVAATLPDDVDPDDPDAFATLSLDGRALAVSDAFGTRVRWFGQIAP